jgi:hypothetical protein
MGDAFRVIIGVVFGWSVSRIDFSWILTQNWSISLWKEWLFVAIVGVLFYGFGIFLPLFVLVTKNG